MTEKELQTQINFLVSELKILREDYNKLSKAKNTFYEMWLKADEKAERYGGLLCTIYDTIHAKVEKYDVIYQLVDDWYESEITK